MTDPSAVTEVVLECHLRPLRQAIASVLPHAEPTKTGDEVNDLARLRFSARADELVIMAANGTTSALAGVTIKGDSRLVRLEHHDGPFEVDVPLIPWRPFLQAFKVGKPTADGDEGLAQLTLRLGEVEIVDVSTTLPGLASRFPVLPRAEAFPDVLGIIRQAVENAAGDVKPLVTAHGPLGLFLPAAKAYKAPLQIEPTGSSGQRGFLVTCGPSFSGVISSRHEDDDSLARRESHRRTLMIRLGILQRETATL